MLNANELLKEAIAQVVSVGIVPGAINPRVDVNTRAKGRFGMCTKTPGSYDYKIELNQMILEANKEKAMNTVVHEVLHSCKGCMNHGPTWAHYASIMNRKFGYDISRTSTYEKIGIERPEAKYTVQCTGCGVKIYRQQMSKLITHTSHYRCKCGSPLKLIQTRA